MPKKVRVAMMSMAHAHADGYARQVGQIPDAQLMCIWDDMPERGKPMAEKYGVPFFGNAMEEVLDRKDVDAIVVNAPTAQHTEIYLKAIERGKHVFTEKALTISTKEADVVVEAVKKHPGIKFTVSLPSRTRGENLLIKELVEDGALGRITMIRGRVAHQAAIDKWFSGGQLWFVDKKAAGGGAMFDLGCHTTDMVRWIMGPPRYAVAQMNNFSRVYKIDDNGVAVVEFANRGLGILDTSFCHRSGPNLFEVFGTEGYVGRGFPGMPLMIQSRKLKGGNRIDGMIIPSRLPENKPSIMEAWISAILKDTPLITTVEDGRNLTELLEGCYIAWRTGKRYTFAK
ncbi:MAG: putative oxidoreductase YcjS [Candidatus Latescibacteria bacterium ADurb.Bin168]|nr:MAG: putative oxidoreductase YcjS [Candidatus Latescibacteria bacterium ADurb.Bin168]